MRRDVTAMTACTGYQYTNVLKKDAGAIRRGGLGGNARGLRPRQFGGTAGGHSRDAISTRLRPCSLASRAPGRPAQQFGTSSTASSQMHQPECSRSADRTAVDLLRQLDEVTGSAPPRQSFVAAGVAEPSAIPAAETTEQIGARIEERAASVKISRRGREG